MAVSCPNRQESGEREEIGTYLCEGRRVKSVLAGNLEADGVSGLGVPSCLGASLDLIVHAVVVAGGEEGKVVGGGDCRGVLRQRVRDGSRVLGDGGLLHIVATLSTNQETFVAKNGIEVGRWALQQVEEGARVHVGLLEMQVQLGTLGLRGREVLRQNLSLEALGDVVVKLKLGVQGIGGVPRLGQSET